MLWNKNGTEALVIRYGARGVTVTVKKLDRESGTEFVDENTIADCPETGLSAILSAVGFDPCEFM